MATWRDTNHEKIIFKKILTMTNSFSRMRVLQDFFWLFGSEMEGLPPVKFSSFCHFHSMLDTKLTCLVHQLNKQRFRTSINYALNK